MPGTRSLNVLMFVYGSGGDVYPNIAIGKTLHERGHQVTVVTNPYFEPSVTEAGLDFLPCGSEEEGRSGIDNPELWKWGKGFQLLFDGVLKSIPETYKIAADRYVPGNTVLVASSLAWGARIAQEKLGVPLATIHLQPLLLRSLNEQPGVVVPERFKPILRPVRKVLLNALDRRVFDPVVLPRLNSFRAGLDLPPVARVLNGWIHSPQLVVGMFPDWFAKPQSDWPANTHLTGFPLPVESTDKNISPELHSFLKAGDPPVVFTLGTAMLFGRQFFQVSSEVCQRLGRRGILLTRFPEQIPANLPSSIRHIDFAQFSTLLPRTAALVHHGGVGTTSEALRAGIPQLVTPMNFDQPDNAARLKRLGVGDSVRNRSYEPDNVTKALSTLLTSRQVAENCRAIAQRFTRIDPIGETCRLIESLVPN